MPALVLYECIVAAEIHGHGPATVGTGRKKLGRDFHVLLSLDHFTDHGFVIKGFLTARLAALEQAVIPLCVEQTLLVKASLLKAVVNVGGDDKIIFVLYQLQKVIVDRFGRVLIAVDEDIAAPVGPEFLLRGKGIEAAAVHIPDTVFPGKIGEVLFKPLAGVGEARRRGQAGARSDHHGVAVL